MAKAKTRVKKIFIICAGIAVNLALFAAMPIANAMFRGDYEKSEAVRDVQLVYIDQLEIKKPPQQHKKIVKPQETAKRADSPSAFKNRFAMDLGVGGGSGSGAAVGSDDLSTMEFEEGETDTLPVAINKSMPDYPRQARAKGVECVVKVRVLIGADGKIEKVNFVDVPEYYGFDETVRTALNQWKFQPAMLKGVPVKVWLEQEFEFKLG